MIQKITKLIIWNTKILTLHQLELKQIVKKNSAYTKYYKKKKIACFQSCVNHKDIQFKGISKCSMS